MGDLYREWARVYDFFYPDRTAEVDFWAALASSVGRRVLDVMCGTAEVSLALALRGLQVLGTDRSPAMLAVATERLAATADYAARNLTLVLGDAMALAAGGGAFDLAFVGGSGSFNHLNDGEAAVALSEMARVLRPGGTLGMELVNPHLLKEVNPTRTFGTMRPAPPGVHVEKLSSNRYDQEAGLFHIEQVTTYTIGGKAGQFETCFDLSIRSPSKVRAMLKSAGFVRVALYGDYDLKPFGLWSPDLLVVARRSTSHV